MHSDFLSKQLCGCCRRYPDRPLIIDDTLPTFTCRSIDAGDYVLIDENLSCTWEGKEDKEKTGPEAIYFGQSGQGANTLRDRLRRYFLFKRNDSNHPVVDHCTGECKGKVKFMYLAEILDDKLRKSKCY